MPLITKEVTLSEEQISYLKGIYKKKFGLWLSSIGGISLLLINVYRDKILYWKEYWFNHTNGNDYSGDYNLAFYVALALTLLFAYIFIRIYLQNIRPLKRDICNKSGLIIHKQIVRKSKIAATKEYFFFFHDLKMPHKEVTPTDYHKYEAGDYFPFLVSEHSKIQIDGFYNYELF